MSNEVLASVVSSRIYEALLAKKFQQLIAILEVANRGSGKMIGCLQKEKAVRDKSKRICTSHRSDTLKEKSFRSKSRKCGAIGKASIGKA